jgi:hypothetical protein
MEQTSGAVARLAELIDRVGALLSAREAALCAMAAERDRLAAALAVAEAARAEDAALRAEAVEALDLAIAELRAAEMQADAARAAGE